MSDTTMRQPFGLRIASVSFLIFWSFLALFPLLWIFTMSFKLPLDAFSESALDVITGPITRERRGGISILDICIAGAIFYAILKVPGLFGRRAVRFFARKRAGLAVLGVAYAAWLYVLVTGFGVTGPSVLGALFGGLLVWLFGFSGEDDDEGGLLGTLLAAVFYVLAAGAGLWFVLPPLLSAVDSAALQIPLVDYLAHPLIGATTEHYMSVWFDRGFYRNFLNTMLVTAGVTTVSLTVGTLAGYGLARSTSTVAFWLLILALVFRALPHSVLVTGYLPPFIASRDILQPLWDAPIIGSFLGLFTATPPTLYGQPVAVIAVLVSINQPFTIWMLRSFFQSIPKELDEAARVDGCSDMEAFRRVIMPVMWPGVVTTGLFSFLLAYNDYLICSLLLNSQNQTMVPSITQFFNSETTTTDQVQAVAAAVSITAPLFLLVMAFQKQIVSGLTAGAVKG
ncbi:ABC-type glycerol-3-phosphate transport system permease component [Hoeflea marina]|uniref:ABC-type glycerol-3-phosphate transport system permease component n=1 Tax=Hoeflea marina TaxID=274592 RepID=A0A317PLX9_9HYPH|nr:carbohydrate ABC transporter permease [Hoeflea marina]PWW01932.1 ABC-type glycerol-3-phosphate transport system permease component [Hoeflea marina]